MRDAPDSIFPDSAPVPLTGNIRVSFSRGLSAFRVRGCGPLPHKSADKKKPENPYQTEIESDNSRRISISRDTMSGH